MKSLRIGEFILEKFYLMSIKNELVGNIELYDGSVLDIETKTDIAASIASVKNQIENVKKNNSYSKEQQEQMIEAYQTKLNKLSEKYSSAPANIILTEYPSDGQILYRKNSKWIRVMSFIHIETYLFPMERLCMR